MTFLAYRLVRESKKYLYFDVTFMLEECFVQLFPYYVMDVIYSYIWCIYKLESSYR